MSRCEFIQVPKPRICIADMNKRVDILTRAIVAPVGQPSLITSQSLVSTFNYQTVATVWAAIKNIKGDAILDGVAVNDIPTHWIYIRFIDNITQDNWISFNNEYYRILEVINMTELSLYLQIKAIKTGKTMKQASQV